MTLLAYSSPYRAQQPNGQSAKKYCHAGEKYEHQIGGNTGTSVSTGGKQMSLIGVTGQAKVCDITLIIVALTAKRTTEIANGLFL